MRNSFLPTMPSPAVAVVAYAGAALGLYLLYNIFTKGVVGAAASVTRGVVGGVLDVGAGAVVGAGEVIGIPATDPDLCRDAIASGRTWDASFACPAGTFLRYVVGGKPSSPGLGDDSARRRTCRCNRNC